MFIQIKSANGKKYIYIIESYRKADGSISHRTIKKLGRLDEFIKDDPNALEKLKAKVKESSVEQKLAQTVDSVNRINSIHAKRNLINTDKGLPQLNYSNFIIKEIWFNVLKLDYRLNYLQEHYHKELKFNLSETLMNEISHRILKLDSSDVDFGKDFALLGTNYTLLEHQNNLKIALDILDEEQMRVVSFIIKKLSLQSGLSFLVPSMQTLKVDLDEKTREELNLDKKDLTIEAEILSLSKKARGERILSILIIIIMQVISRHLNENNLNFSLGEIRKALKAANVLVNFPLQKDCPCSYIKANNGKKASIVNKIMTAFKFGTILNIQDRIELSKRLHTKFGSDSDIIPKIMFDANIK